MGKFFRFIGILLLILVVGFLVLCVVTDSQLKVERTIAINAPKSVVWDQVVKFKNWEHWSPWKEMDPSIVVDYTGIDGEQGSTQHYKGGSMTGEGKTTNMGVTDGEMKYKMNFISPMPGEADGYYKVIEENGKTKVIWYLHQDLAFWNRGLTAIFGAQKFFNKTFDRGLELLKNYSEAHAAEAAKPIGTIGAITEMQFTEHIYAVARKNITPADMHDFFSAAYGPISKEAGQRIIGPPVAVYYTWDTTKMAGDVAAGFPIADKVPVKGATIVTVPASLAYKMVYVGPYSGLVAAHRAITQQLATNGKTKTIMLEEFVRTPGNDTDSNKYETNIIYLVK